MNNNHNNKPHASHRVLEMHLLIPACVHLWTGGEQERARELHAPLALAMHEAHGVQSSESTEPILHLFSNAQAIQRLHEVIIVTF